MPVALWRFFQRAEKTTPMNMDIIKTEKWLIDGDSNLFPWEKFELKLIVNWQIADRIDRAAENQCDSVDFVHECMQNFVRNISCSWQEVQQRLHCLHSGAEYLKFRILQQAENAKRRRDEQERLRWLLSSAASRQPMFYSCST